MARRRNPQQRRCRDSRPEGQPERACITPCAVEDLSPNPGPRRCAERIPEMQAAEDHGEVRIADN